MNSWKDIDTIMAYKIDSQIFAAEYPEDVNDVIKVWRSNFKSNS